jgi:integrase
MENLMVVEIKLIPTPNLFLRGGVLYFRARAGGKLRMKRCPYQLESAMTGLKSRIAPDGKREYFGEGKPRQSVFTSLSKWMGYEREQADERARNPDAIPDGTVPTWEKLEAVYLEIAADHFARTGRPKPYVAQKNAKILKTLLKQMGVTRTESMTLATVAKFDKWVTGRVLDADEEAAAHKRYSCSRVISMAQSCWAKWTRDYYRRRGLVIPANVDHWPQVDGFAPIYVLPAKGLREATDKGGQAMEENNPGLWLAFALMRHHGMRPGDAARAEWAWFQPKDNGRYSLRFQPSKTKRSTKGRYVDQTISAAHWARLRAAWDKAGDGGACVVPGGEEKRLQAIVDVNAAMRAFGWTTNKASYELRKLFVSEIYNRYGLTAAAAYSGDRDTTILYYYAAADPDNGPVLDMPKLEPLAVAQVLSLAKVG